MAQKAKLSEKTPGTIKKFALASFLNDMGSDMIYPIWPIFVTSVLGANMTILGLIDGLGEAIVSISSALSGFLSDKFRKRKFFIWTGYLMGSFSRIGYAFSLTWQNLIWFRILDRAGKIRGAPRDAMVADISQKSNRGGNFGILRSMDHMGAVAGILVCIFFFEKLGYNKLFIFAALPSIGAVFIVLFFIKDLPSPHARAFKGFQWKSLDKNLALLFAANAFFSLGFFSYSFLILYGKAEGFKNTRIIIFYLVFTLAASLVAVWFGKLSDYAGRKKILGLSFFLWIGVCLLLSLEIKSYVHMIFLFVLYGIQKGAMEPVQKTFVSELAPPDLKASVLGSFQLVTGVLALPASFIAGLLWDNFSRQAPLYFSVAMTLFALVFLSFTKEPGKENIIT